MRSTRPTRPTRFVAPLVLLLLLVSLALPLAACSRQEAAAPEAVEPVASLFPVTITDDAGRDVTVETEPMRIVSLAPANTEIVYALGLFDRLVGVTTYDDYPAEVVDLPKVGDFVTPNLEAIAAAEPDIVLATTGVQADAIEQLEALGAIVVAVDPQDLEGLLADIELVGDVLGAPDEAVALVEQMRSDIARITETVSTEEPTPCFIEIAQDPLFTAGTGTLLDDLIQTAGGQNVVTEPGYVGYSLEQLVIDDPQVYLATLGSMSDPSALADRPGYDGLSAVKSGRVAVLEDNLVSRPGPRIVQGIGQIAAALHPDLFETSATE
jgi:iron complex transport system substrate-binding protein